MTIIHSKSFYTGGSMEHLLLINDGTINLSQLNKEKIIFFGERHVNVSDTEFVKKIIDTVEPDYVLVEGLGDLELLRKSDKTNANKVEEDDLYYGKLTKWWIEVSLDYDIPFIGFELINREGLDGSDLATTFKAREEHWIKVIKKYVGSKKHVLIVCGDTHLRTIACKALGQASPLYKAFPTATFIRLAEPEIE